MLPIALLFSSHLVFSQQLYKPLVRDAWDVWLNSKNSTSEAWQAVFKEFEQVKIGLPKLCVNISNSRQIPVLSLSPALKPVENVGNWPSGGGTNQTANNCGVQFIAHPVCLLLFFSTFVGGVAIFYWVASFAPVERALNGVLFFLFDELPSFFR